MGIAGLATYSSTRYFCAYMSNNKNNGIDTEGEFPVLASENKAEKISPKENTSVSVPYTRCITASIKTEEVYGAESNGEMIYSYKASEQSFKIWINSDGEKKTYSVEGIDKDGKPFTKEFDPYEINPEYADFPEFAALCMYIQNTDETADMLANEYFASDDILEKCDYSEKLQGFSVEGFFEKTQAMMDNIDKLLATFQRITGMKNEVDSFFEPFFTKYLVEDVDLNDYPDIAGAISEELSSEKIIEESEPEEVVTPLGFGFANAGMMGYGMSAALVEKPGCDDTIIRVKIATGHGDQVVDVNLSKFDPSNATPVEMFAYCQYKDACGEGVDSKWGSWNALKSISSAYDGCNFGTFDNVINQKMNWVDKLEKSETSWLDSKTNEIIMSASDILKLFEETRKITAKELKEEKDWREISDEEWDKMLEGLDKYIDAYKERLKELKEMQDEAANKAAAQADPDMKAIAASEAALSVAANGFDGGDNGEEESELPPADGKEHEKNWTKKLDTDDQTILREAKAAQDMEKAALSKFEELQLTDTTTVGVSTHDGVTESRSKKVI